MQKTGPQRVPSCRSLRLQLKKELALAIKKHLSGSSCRSTLLFVKALQKPWGRVVIFDLLLQSRPPKKKYRGASLLLLSIPHYVRCPMHAPASAATSCKVANITQCFRGCVQKRTTLENLPVDQQGNQWVLWGSKCSHLQKQPSAPNWPAVQEADQRPANARTWKARVKWLGSPMEHCFPLNLELKQTTSLSRLLSPFNDLKSHAKHIVYPELLGLESQTIFGAKEAPSIIRMAGMVSQS